jgi:hypothetical protein
MNQKLSEWASIAEIVSGIAVVITLMFLIIEIHESTNVTRASMYASTLDSLIENRSQQFQYPELNRIVEEFVDGEAADFEASERRLLIPFLQNIFQIYEKAYFTREYDLLGESEWTRFERNICLNYDRLQSVGLADDVAAVVTGEFWAYIETACRG